MGRTEEAGPKRQDRNARHRREMEPRAKTPSESESDRKPGQTEMNTPPAQQTATTVSVVNAFGSWGSY
ncbi:hypothetical protein A9F13_19g00660 [Clavispora lusitaniae]|uniref:Uncharacterized protein n=1 Tax=Clavispora lusitaniae TaxID=36911 RepID=A0AA91T030_CLALS|nr:hypothetical protein A9F13_19g00660 [Clavispora lusitaniae]